MLAFCKKKEFILCLKFRVMFLLKAQSTGRNCSLTKKTHWKILLSVMSSICKAIVFSGSTRYPKTSIWDWFFSHKISLTTDHSRWKLKFRFLVQEYSERWKDSDSGLFSLIPCQTPLSCRKRNKIGQTQGVVGVGDPVSPSKEKGYLTLMPQALATRSHTGLCDGPQDTTTSPTMHSATSCGLTHMWNTHFSWNANTKHAVRKCWTKTTSEGIKPEKNVICWKIHMHPTTKEKSLHDGARSSRSRNVSCGQSG